MKNTWSISESIYVFYSYDNTRVYIANPETKKFWGPVKKISETIEDPEVHKNDGYQIKFENSKIKVLISGVWYILGNPWTEDLISQLSSATIRDGEIGDVVFGFNPIYPEQTIPLFPGSEIYKESEAEFIRKINLSLYSKTTKYKPGHKYESENGTYLYLGEVISHKSDKRNSKRYTTSSNGVRILHAFTSDFSGKKDIESVFRESLFKDITNYPEDPMDGIIFLLDKNKSMADMGEILKLSDPTWKIEDSWETRIEEFMKSSKKAYSLNSSLLHYTGLRDLFGLFDITTELTPVVSDKSKAMITDILKTEFRYILFKFYDLNIHQYGSNILSTDKPEVQAQALVKFFLMNYFDTQTNYYYQDYTKEMFKLVFGVDLEEVAKKSIEEYKLLTISTSDFPELIDNFGYLEYREPEKYLKDIDFVYTNEKKRNFDTFLENGMYKDVIKDIYKKALETNGSELKEFLVANVGTLKSPCLHYTMKITLDDIVRYFKVNNINELPEEFKHEMIKNKIYQVCIKTRDDIQVTI